MYLANVSGKYNDHIWDLVWLSGKNHDHISDPEVLSRKNYDHIWDLGGLSGKIMVIFGTWEGYLAKKMIIFRTWEGYLEKIMVIFRRDQMVTKSPVYFWKSKIRIWSKKCLNIFFTEIFDKIVPLYLINYYAPIWIFLLCRIIIIFERKFFSKFHLRILVTVWPIFGHEIFGHEIACPPLWGYLEEIMITFGTWNGYLTKITIIFGTWKGFLAELMAI